jgi:UDP-glucose-4-epimerase GalE
MNGAVLVTGGAGYIGSHVCKALAQTGAVPICFDTLENGHRWAVRWGPMVHGDIGDEEAVKEVFERYHPRAVVHLAGYIEVGESVRRPRRYINNNATKSQILVDAVTRHGADAFVFSSTCAVYGSPQSDTISETHRILPLNPYAESKAMVERQLTKAAGLGLRSVSLRYFNAAGSDPEGEIGESHAPETHLIPLACDAALGLGPQLTLHGADYPTHDGSCVRDFVHVCDLAQAHIRAISWLNGTSHAGHHEVFNIGTGSGNSVLEVLKQAGDVAGRAVPFAVGPRRPGDSPRLVGDITRADEVLGWRPTQSLATQIESSLQWRRTRPR